MKTKFSLCDFGKVPKFMRFFWEEQQKYLRLVLLLIDQNKIIWKLI